MTKSIKPKRRFLQFSLRTLLVVMLVVCAMLGWKVNEAKKQREGVAWVQGLGGSVSYDYEYDDAGKRVPNPQPPGPRWLRELLGIDFFDEVVRVRGPIHLNPHADITPLAGLTSREWLELHRRQVNDVSPLAGMTSLKWLDFGYTLVSDLSPLAELKGLETLRLTNTLVSDLTPLAGLTSLERLELRGTQVSDVSPLAGLTSLEYLDLGGTQVSDVTPLVGLTSLERLYLDGTQVSDVTPLARLTTLLKLGFHKTQVSQEDYETLQEALPNCDIKWSRAAESP